MTSYFYRRGLNDVCQQCYSHLNVFAARRYITAPQMIRPSIKGIVCSILPPSVVIFLTASLKNDRGKMFAIGWSQLGSSLVGKKVPESKNWGKVIKLTIGPAAFSSFPSPAIKYPNPKNAMSAIIERKSSSTKVIQP